MKGKVKWILNANEIQAAEAQKRLNSKLVLKTPEPKFETGDIYIKLSSIDVAYFDNTSKTIDVKVNGELFKLVFEKKVWEKIKEYLGRN